MSDSQGGDCGRMLVHFAVTSSRSSDIEEGRPPQGIESKSLDMNRRFRLSDFV